MPPTKIPETRLMTFEISQEMDEILCQWYLESFETKIPMLKYTQDDLRPVLSEMIANSPQSDKESTKAKNLLNVPFHRTTPWKICVLLGVAMFMELN